jgi:hypothetical protein
MPWRSIRTAHFGSPYRNKKQKGSRTSELSYAAFLMALSLSDESQPVPNGFCMNAYTYIHACIHSFMTGEMNPSWVKLNQISLPKSLMAT